MPRARFGPKGGATVKVAPAKPTGRELTNAMIDELCAKRQQSRDRWSMIEELLSAEGYEVVADLFEHSIRKRR